MGLRRKHENMINPEEDAEDAEDAEHLEKTLQKWLWQKKEETEGSQSILIPRERSRNRKEESRTQTKT